MDYKKVIKFRYFQITEQSQQEGKLQKKLFDFSRWLLLLKERDLLQKTINCYEIKARVEKIKYDKENNIVAIRLMKLRDVNIPVKARDGKDEEAIPLDDDEYLGEDLTMIYDDNAHILMVQSNRFSLNISAICELIKYTSGFSEKSIVMEPIFDMGADTLRTGAYKTLEVAFSNVTYLSEERIGKRPLSSIIHPIKSLGGIAGKITVSLGHSKIETLNRIEIQNLIGDIKENEKYIRSARVKVKSDEETVEIIDLFDNISNDYIEFVLVSREILDFETMFYKMEKKYLQRKPELYQWLKIPER